MWQESEIGLSVHMEGVGVTVISFVAPLKLSVAVPTQHDPGGALQGKECT